MVKSEGEKRKIAETSNVITETLPKIEREQVSMIVTLKYKSSQSAAFLSVCVLFNDVNTTDH